MTRIDWRGWVCGLALGLGLAVSMALAELGLDGRAAAALKLFAAGNALGRSIFATPGIPPERAAALRQAFMDTMADPELIAFTKERNIDFGPTLNGAALERIVMDTLSVSPETAAQVKKARSGE